MIVGNRYELHDMVAQGAYGMVFRATDTRDNKPVAVKMLSGGARQDPHVVERLVREQQALQALSGTHAVGAIDLCRAQTGALCLVMEWLEGVDMEHHLEGLEERGTPMSSSDLLAILHPVLDTLEKAHELGIVHRDIKPANIFLLSDNRGVRLLDFGLSRLKSSATLTAVGMVMGSPSYMAPEAWKGNSKAIGRQADLYSVGVIVFRALTGKVPFDAEALLDKMRLATTGKRPSVRARRPDLPLVIDAWVERALAINPARRFQHAAHFLEALEAALAGLPLPEHTFVLPSRGVTSVPPPKTTEAEREDAISAALSRAASLIRRFAGNFSRAPNATSTEPEAGSPHADAAPPELPKPPPIAPAPRRAAPVVPPASSVAEKKTVELGDDDLVEWLLDDDPGTARKAGVQRPAATSGDTALTRVHVRQAQPSQPSSASDLVSTYDDDWDEVTLPRAQEIVSEVANATAAEGPADSAADGIASAAPLQMESPSTPGDDGTAEPAQPERSEREQSSKAKPTKVSRARAGKAAATPTPVPETLREKPGSETRAKRAAEPIKKAPKQKTSKKKSARKKTAGKHTAASKNAAVKRAGQPSTAKKKPGSRRKPKPSS